MNYALVLGPTRGHVCSVRAPDWSLFWRHCSFGLFTIQLASSSPLVNTSVDIKLHHLKLTNHYQVLQISV